jgi:hypothetical protein
MSDSPSDDAANDVGNFATLNPLLPTTLGTYKNGNIEWVRSGNHAITRATIALPSTGKFMFVAEAITTGNAHYAGVVQESSTLGANTSVDVAGYGCYSYSTTNSIKKLASNIRNSSATWSTAGQQCAVCVDIDNDKIFFGQESGGDWVWATGDPGAGTGGDTMGLTGGTGALFFAVSTENQTVAALFDDRDWNASIETGYKTLCTANLPAPAITDPSAYMAVDLYTGNGTAIGSGGKVVNQAGNSTFSPDLVWIKNRDATDRHVLTDTVRGATKYLSSDNTDIEVTEAETLATFNSDGFTVGDDVQVNTNTENYVAWQWERGATPAFDIVIYTGTGANRTIAHSVGIKPAFFIIKERDDTEDWNVWHKDLPTPTTGRLRLQTTSAVDDSATYWNTSEPSSSVFSLGSHVATNNNGTLFAAWLWGEVEGFSKFGSYVGNGNSDGSFIFCGFRPAWILIKQSNSGGNAWAVYDTDRSIYNSSDTVLRPNRTDGDNSGGSNTLDILSNGFKLRTADSFINNGTYIFAAFAENPFGGSGVAQARAR